MDSQQSTELWRKCPEIHLEYTGLISEMVCAFLEHKKALNENIFFLVHGVMKSSAKLPILVEPILLNL